MVGREGARNASFADLGLSDRLLRAVAATGYSEPTPIQIQAIPPALAGRDLLGCAQTGTGKTAAFALPILQRLVTDRTQRPAQVIRALVLAPTRELAAQIGASFERYGKGSGLRSTVVFGGVSKRPQVSALRRGIDILVATPGRLLDLMGERALCLSGVRTLVLDEADRMLDMGFIHDVRRVVRAISRERQTMLFSATLPAEIRELADAVLTDPVRVAVAPVASTVDTTEQAVYAVEKPSKVDLLLTLLQDQAMERVLVFTRTKHGADKVARKLARAGVESAALHGNKSQGARERALAGFKLGRTRLIVATDIAARGLDVKGLTHVVNFDLPAEPETYVHRIGRTGRAGAAGVALSFCSNEERGHLASIERLTRRPLMRVDTPKLVQVTPAPRAAAIGHPGEDQRSGDARHPGTAKRQGQEGRRPAARRSRSAERTERRSADEPRPTELAPQAGAPQGSAPQRRRATVPDPWWQTSRPGRGRSAGRRRSR